MAQTTKKTMLISIASIFLLALSFGTIIKLFKIHQSLLFSSIYYLLMMFIIIYRVKIIEKRDLKSIGLDCENLFLTIAYAVGIFGVLSLFLLVFYLLGTSFNLSHPALSDVLLRTFHNIFILGFAEELVFRGYIQGRLNELSKSKLIPIVLTSLIFAVWHYPTNFYFYQVVFAFFFGLVLSFFRFRSKKNIIISLPLAHGLYNSCLLWVGFLFR